MSALRHRFCYLHASTTNSQLNTHTRTEHHMSCVFNTYLLNRITRFYRALKTRSVPCDVLRTVWFSWALGRFCLPPATLAANETSACTGHTPALSNELTGMEGHTCTRPLPFSFSALLLLLAVGFASASFLADGTAGVSARACTAWTVHFPPLSLPSSLPGVNSAELRTQIGCCSAPLKCH